MIKLKFTRWYRYAFDADQKQARRMWRASSEYYFDLIDALHMGPDGTKTREEFHDRLDKLLNTIDRTREEAVELFPEVKESFTISEGTLP